MQKEILKALDNILMGDSGRSLKGATSKQGLSVVWLSKK